MRGKDGFTLIELLIAMALMLAITAALFGLVHPAQGTFQAQPERSDMQQRLRVASDALARDLLTAGAGLPPATSAPVMPYRAGRQQSDPRRGVFYRPDTVTAVYVPWDDTAVVSHTYYVKSDRTASRLMHYDGEETDLPLVDHVVALAFSYFDVEQSPLDPAVLQNGPWLPDDTASDRFDADLLRIRRVRVRLRVEAGLASMRGPAGTLFARGGTSTSMTRYLPDQEIQFDVALRNVNGDR